MVDDEASKRRQVVELLRQRSEVNELEEASSYQSALECLRRKDFDWVVLDMRLTTFDLTAADGGGRPRKFGGEEVLRKMQRRGVAAKAVILTQYSLFRDRGATLSLDDLRERLAERFECFAGLVSFQHSNDDWQHQLMNLIFKERS